jgi:hypothetical protein
VTLAAWEEKHVGRFTDIYMLMEYCSGLLPVLLASYHPIDTINPKVLKQCANQAKSNEEQPKKKI